MLALLLLLLFVVVVVVVVVVFLLLVEKGHGKRDCVNRTASCQRNMAVLL